MLNPPACYNEISTTIIISFIDIEDSESCINKTPISHVIPIIPLNRVIYMFFAIDTIIPNNVYINREIINGA
jgi:hypothetical protein